MAVFNPNESVELVEYDPRWPALFREERARLEAVLGDGVVEIKHIGSTSIPGLRAKPILDILAAVETFEPLEDYQRRLEPLGYYFHSHENDAERLFFWKSAPRTHHLHIVEFATWEHQRHLIFRDYLRQHADVAKLYEELKTELAETCAGDRAAYTSGKSAFIRATVTRAVKEIGARR